MVPELALQETGRQHAVEGQAAQASYHEVQRKCSRVHHATVVNRNVTLVLGSIWRENPITRSFLTFSVR